MLFIDEIKLNTGSNNIPGTVTAANNKVFGIYSTFYL